MSELAMFISEIQQCGEKLIDISKELTELFSENAATSQAEDTPTFDVEEPKQEITLTEVRKLLADKARSGYREKVKALITKYGADTLSEISAERYPELMKEAGDIGES